MSAYIENRGPELAAVVTFFLVVSNIAIILRCAVRLVIVKSVGWDDYIMAAASCSFTLFCTFALIGVHHGTGKHFADLEPSEIKKAMMFWWLCYPFYCLTMVLTKMSIGWCLLRFTTRKSYMWILYSSLGITIFTGIAFLFVTIFQCRPISLFWDWEQKGKCVDVEIIIALVGVYSAFNIITDLILAIIPGFIIWNLNMSLRTKIVLIPLMTMGCIASCAVAIRAGHISQFRDPDFLWATLDIAIWSTTEQGLAITAASLAMLRPLMRLIGQKLGIYKVASTTPNELLGEDRKQLVPSDGKLDARRSTYDGQIPDLESQGISVAVQREIVWSREDSASSLNYLNNLSPGKGGHEILDKIPRHKEHDGYIEKGASQVLEKELPRLPENPKRRFLRL